MKASTDDYTVRRTHSSSLCLTHKGKSWFIFHLNPLTWKKNIWLCEQTSAFRENWKKRNTHIRSSNFPSHFTPQRKRLYSAIQMQPVKGRLKLTSAFLLLPEINFSSFEILFPLYNTDLTWIRFKHWNDWLKYYRVWHPVLELSTKRHFFGYLICLN